MITLLANENLHLVLDKPEVQDMIERAIAEGEGEYSGTDLVVKLYRGEFQLWLLHEEHKLKLVMVTRIGVWPKKKRLIIELIAGEDFFLYTHHLDELKAWALEHGCDGIGTLCRPGFQKEAKRFGFKTQGVAMLLEI